jgi:hypothetical protein
MKYQHLSDAELIRYVDNLQSATALERELVSRLFALHKHLVKETERGSDLSKSAQ